MKRLALILILTLASTTAFAQATATAATASTASAATPSNKAESAAPAPAAETGSADEVRNAFSEILRRTGSRLQEILVLDPNLLSNDSFLAGYPDLAQFVAAHPEVRRNPNYYLSDFSRQEPPHSSADKIIEPFAIMMVMGGVLFTLAWLIRTIVEQKRWSRLSKTQTEVHTKILDRFGTSAELLEYMRTPAGTKFLESAPIPLHEAKAAQNAPLSRIMWSIQIGVIVAAGAIGMLLVSTRLTGESNEALFALGSIALCIGGGFIVSAIVSVIVAKRLGMWEAPGAPAALDDSASMR